MCMTDMRSPVLEQVTRSDEAKHQEFSPWPCIILGGTFTCMTNFRCENEITPQM